MNVKVLKQNYQLFVNVIYEYKYGYDMTTISKVIDFATALKKIKLDVTLEQAQTYARLLRSLENGNLEKRVRAEKEHVLKILQNGIGRSKILQLNKLRKLCQAEISYLLENEKHTLLTVMKIDLPEYKRIIRLIDDRHPALAFFKIDGAEYHKVNHDYKLKTKARQAQRTLENVDGYIQTATDMLTSDNYIQVAMGLCAVTGRRPSEILITAQFETTNDNTVRMHSVENCSFDIENPLMFSGQMKGKTRQGNASESTRDEGLFWTNC